MFVHTWWSVSLPRSLNLLKRALCFRNQRCSHERLKFATIKPPHIVSEWRKTAAHISFLSFNGLCKTFVDMVMVFTAKTWKQYVCCQQNAKPTGLTITRHSDYLPESPIALKDVFFYLGTGWSDPFTDNTNPPSSDHHTQTPILISLGPLFSSWKIWWIIWIIYVYRNVRCHNNLVSICEAFGFMLSPFFEPALHPSLHLWSSFPI